VCASAIRRFLGLDKLAPLPFLVEVAYSDEPFDDAWCVEYDPCEDGDEDRDVDEDYRISSPDNRITYHTELHTRAADLVGQSAPLFFRMSDLGWIVTFPTAPAQSAGESKIG
jgi:hypothetical protein